ncbi:MAG: Trm112 family protein [Desulfobacter sp.]
MAVSKELLEILVCPKCKGEVVLTEEESGLVCDACALMFEIRDDIPIMLIEEATPVKSDPEA